jgi:hypothetical protein
MPGPHPNPRVRLISRIGICAFGVLSLVLGIHFVSEWDWSSTSRLGIPAPILGILGIAIGPVFFFMAWWSWRKFK